MAKTYSAFLGANTPRGFVSLFDEMYNPMKAFATHLLLRVAPVQENQL